MRDATPSRPFHLARGRQRGVLCLDAALGLEAHADTLDGSGANSESGYAVGLSH